MATLIVCYLDDSGENRENYQTLGGLVSTEEAWREFESIARQCLDHYGIDYLHSVDLHHRRRAFQYWNTSQTRRFASDLFSIVNVYAGFAVEFSVDKTVFKGNKERHDVKRETSPLSFCFRGILDRIVKDEGFKLAEKSCNDASLSFVIESGHKNNKDVAQHFQRIKEMDPERFGSMEFVEKKSCIALQVADFIAFYSRRMRNSPNDKPRYSDQRFFYEAIGDLKLRAFVANDFST